MGDEEYQKGECVGNPRTSTDILKSKGLLTEIEGENETLDEQIKAWNKTLEQEQEKWDAIIKLDENSTNLLENVTFEEAFENFEKSPLFHLEIPEVQISICRKLADLLFGPQPLTKSLKKERNLILNITNSDFDNDNKLHCRILQTIYKKLTKSHRNCPRFGPHWEDIGFQGNDPATDLRGAGLLALLHLLYLLTNYMSVAQKMFKMSLDSIQNFPFCLMSINMTRIALQALQDNKLSKICNARKQVMGVVNEFYLAVFLHLYKTWKDEHITMLQSGHVISFVENYAAKHPKTLLKSLPKLLKNIKTSLTSSQLSTTSSNSIQFNNALSPTLEPSYEKSSISDFDEVLEM